MKRNKCYDWKGIEVTENNTDLSTFHNLEKVIKVLADVWQMERNIAEHELRFTLKEYQTNSQILQSNGTAPIHKELTKIHDLVKKVKSKELSDFSIVLKAKKQDGKTVNLHLKTSYLNGSFLNYTNTLADPKERKQGRPKGMETETLILWKTALTLNKRYKETVNQKKDRMVLIGIILFGIDALQGHIIDKKGQINDRDKLYDKVKTWFKN